MNWNVLSSCMQSHIWGKLSLCMKQKCELNQHKREKWGKGGNLCFHSRMSPYQRKAMQCAVIFGQSYMLLTVSRMIANIIAIVA